MTHGQSAAPARNLQLHETSRQFVVRAVLLIYILSLIEGPLRKWFLPEQAGPLTLLRDPFVIALYGYALVNNLMDRRGMAAFWLGFAAVTSCFGLVQYMVNGFGLVGWLLGVRTYWLYMPLAFVVASAFRGGDVLLFLRLNLFISIPYAALVASQYGAGTFAFINRGVGADEPMNVSLGDGLLRPFGLFTYTGPNVQFTTAMIAMFAAMYLVGRNARLGWPQLLITAGAVGTMSVLTGSRGFYFEAGIILGFAILALIIVRPNALTLLRILGLLAFTGLVAALSVYVFSDMSAAMERRFIDAARVEGNLWNRIYYSAFTFIDAFAVAPFFGHGIGAGASGVANYLGLPPLIYGEADTQRNINELGLLLGSLFLILRWSTAIWLAITALNLARSGYLIVLPLTGFVMIPLFFGSITNSPLNSFLVWIFIGLILSMKMRLKSG